MAGSLIVDTIRFWVIRIFLPNIFLPKIFLPHLPRCIAIRVQSFERKKELGLTAPMLENHLLDEFTETELLHQAKLGDFAAFQKLIAMLQPRVYGLVFCILQQAQDAEDATQQTFLSLIEHIADFREESAVATWVLRIATNNALKILRKKRTVKMISMSEMTSEDSYAGVPHPEFIAPWSQTADEIVQQAEVQAELEKSLLELDDKYRLVFVLRDVEGLSVRETAQALELTESTVKVRLLRARLALRERLTRKFGDASQAMTPDHKHPLALL